MVRVWRSYHGKGKSHACHPYGPRTLCGHVITDDWRFDEVRQADESTVECSRCRAALDQLETP